MTNYCFGNEDHLDVLRNTLKRVCSNLIFTYSAGGTIINIINFEYLEAAIKFHIHETIKEYNAARETCFYCKHHRFSMELK